MIPTVHMNGTSRHALLDDIEEATNSLLIAQNALRAMSPNGRDYYPQGPDAIQTAMDEHQVRIDRVRAVREELNTIAEAIQSQRSGKPMKLQVYCAMCGKEKEHTIARDNIDPGMTIRSLLERHGWIVQMNYPNLDIYCSRRCAQ